MKIICNRNELIKAINIVMKAVPVRTTKPVLECILVDAQTGQIRLTGNDMELGIETACQGVVLEKGLIAIDAKIFSEIVRKLPEEIVTIETDDRMVTYITCGQVDYQIVGMSSVEYPDLPSFEKTDGITISSKVLKEMIRQTVYAVSENMAKPIYTGSLYELEQGVFRIVAIDGYRMAIRSENVDSESETSFVVPGKTQLEVLKLLTDEEENVEINIGQRHITFKIRTYSVISRLIEGTFLDYKSTIPKDEKTSLVINTRKLIDSVERMSLLNNDRVQSPVRCKFHDNEIRLSCASAVGRANDVINNDIIGDSVEIGFNNRYMLDALKNTDTDEVKMVLNGPVSPIVIKPVQGDSFLSIVVPMRLANEN